MLELRQSLRFAAESPQEDGVHRQVFAQQFQRQISRSLSVPDLVDVSHGAATDELIDAVALEECSTNQICHTRQTNKKLHRKYMSRCAIIIHNRHRLQNAGWRRVVQRWGTNNASIAHPPAAGVQWLIFF